VGSSRRRLARKSKCVGFAKRPSASGSDPSALFLRSREDSSLGSPIDSGRLGASELEPPSDLAQFRLQPPAHGPLQPVAESELQRRRQLCPEPLEPRFSTRSSWLTRGGRYGLHCACCPTCSPWRRQATREAPTTLAPPAGAVRCSTSDAGPQPAGQALRVSPPAAPCIGLGRLSSGIGPQLPGALARPAAGAACATGLGDPLAGLSRGLGRRGHGRSRNLPPRLESLCHLLAVLRARKEVAPRLEVRGDRAIGSEKTLGVSWRLKSPYTPLPLTRRLVGMFRAIIG
jgi:hypothetical protein